MVAYFYKCVYRHEMSEFATPGTYKELSCAGHPCATCGKCRDWCYTGDLASWQWIQNSKNWDSKDIEPWCSGQYWNHFKKRDGATCHGTPTDPSTLTVPTSPAFASFLASPVALHPHAPPSCITTFLCSCFRSYNFFAHGEGSFGWSCNIS
ncbi:unnamed protein product [Rotaria sp. Silwood2]|nr:unnamed protein product [Rotaria sp. Silwood2]